VELEGSGASPSSNTEEERCLNRQVQYRPRPPTMRLTDRSEGHTENTRNE